MSDLPAAWQQALDVRRARFDLSEKSSCVRLLHDEDDALRCDRYGPVCWLSWYRQETPGAADLTRLDALCRAGGAEDWHVHGMSDRGRDPHARRHWRSPGAPDTWTADEDGLHYRLRADRGQSPGLFLDQRPNRAWVRDHAAGARVLNLFAYTGAFGLVALAGGAAEVSQVDVSEPALAWARDNAALNGLEEAAVEYHTVDVRLFLEGCRRRGRRFDGVVCDPPTFARPRRRAEAVFRIERDLPVLVQACLAVVEPGGWVLVSSNYEGWRRRDFESAAAMGAGARGVVQPAPGPGPDCGGDGKGAVLNSVVVRGV